MGAARVAGEKSTAARDHERSIWYARIGWEPFWKGSPKVSKSDWPEAGESKTSPAVARRERHVKTILCYHDRTIQMLQ